MQTSFMEIYINIFFITFLFSCFPTSTSRVVECDWNKKLIGLFSPYSLPSFIEIFLKIEYASEIPGNLLLVTYRNRMCSTAHCSLIR